jgi:hypothetical protein
VRERRWLEAVMSWSPAEIFAGGQNPFIDPSGKGNPNLADQTTIHAENVYERINMSAMLPAMMVPSAALYEGSTLN